MVGRRPKHGFATPEESWSFYSSSLLQSSLSVVWAIWRLMVATNPEAMHPIPDIKYNYLANQDFSYCHAKCNNKVKKLKLTCNCSSVFKSKKVFIKPFLFNILSDVSFDENYKPVLLNFTRLYDLLKFKCVFIYICK